MTANHWLLRFLLLVSLPSAVAPAAPAGRTEAEILRRFGLGQPGAPLAPFPDGKFQLTSNETVVFIGQENFVREQKAGELEAQLASAFADKAPRFRPMAWEADTVYEQWRDLNFGPWAGQIESAGATMIVAQFGQMEALDGVGRLPEFTTAYHRLLDQFAGRTRRLVLIAPMPFEKPLASHAPDLTQRNGDVAAYANAVREIARQRGAVFVVLPAGYHDGRTRRPRPGRARREAGGAVRQLARLAEGDPLGGRGA